MSAESAAPVRYEFDAATGVARITLADPAGGNAINLAAVAALFDAARSVGRDGARVVVLAAEGRFFSVGGDLGAMAQADDQVALIDDLAEGLHRAVSELLRSDAIVVSVVQGTAAGAGFPLAAAGDIVIAAEHAKFSLAYGKVGLSPDGGSSLMVHTLGLHRTLRLALLGDLLTAAEAHAAGLVARVVPADELDACVDDVVGALAAGSGGANAAAKHLLRRAAAPEPEAALREESLAIRARVATPDGREGIAAFLEKRSPRFNA